jgi:2-phospho-L-lactate/phosphoenolpyruvate guanylyltransferase
MSGIWALIPIKRMSAAKQRLASVLSAEERAALMTAMATDVLRTVSAVRGLAGVLVVAGDETGLRIARGVGADAIEDRLSDTQSAAVTLGVSHLAARNAAAVLVLPADIPMATAAEIALVAEYAAAASRQHNRAVTLVPSRDGDGSNALAVSPISALTFCFGPDSRRRHLAAAEEAGLAVRELSLPGIGLDIDGPDDLRELLRLGGQGLTHALLAKRGIGARFADTAAAMMAAE